MINYLFLFTEGVEGNVPFSSQQFYKFYVYTFDRKLCLLCKLFVIIDDRIFTRFQRTEDGRKLLLETVIECIACIVVRQVEKNIGNEREILICLQFKTAVVVFLKRRESFVAEIATQFSMISSNIT